MCSLCIFCFSVRESSKLDQAQRLHWTGCSGRISYYSFHLVISQEVHQEVTQRQKVMTDWLETIDLLVFIHFSALNLLISVVCFREDISDNLPEKDEDSKVTSFWSSRRKKDSTVWETAACGRPFHSSLILLFIPCK